MGWWAGSLALLSDAGHNFGDVIGLALAWGAAMPRPAPGVRSLHVRPRRHDDPRRARERDAAADRGRRHRLRGPAAAARADADRRRRRDLGRGARHRRQRRDGAAVHWRDATTDLNVRGAYWHMAADAAVSAAVVVAAIAIRYTGLAWIDPAMSLVVAIVILVGTWSLMRDSMRLALGAVPEHIDDRRRPRLSRGAARRRGRPRPAHLGDEHDRQRADRAPRDAGRASRRRVPVRGRRDDRRRAFASGTSRRRSRRRTARVPASSSPRTRPERARQRGDRVTSQMPPTAHDERDPCASVGRSPRNAMPTSADVTGSAVVNTPARPAGTWRSPDSHSHVDSTLAAIA